MDGIIDSMDISLSKFWEIVKDSEVWRGADHGVATPRLQIVRRDLATEQQYTSLELPKTNNGVTSKGYREQYKSLPLA